MIKKCTQEKNIYSNFSYYFCIIETAFRYPAYIAIYDWSSCCEYALILKEEKKIVYVFLQGDFF